MYTPAIKHSVYVLDLPKQIVAVSVWRIDKSVFVVSSYT